jgi:hypothetical protein
MNKQTQRSKLLSLLAGGHWISLPSILALGIAKYNARIFELRRRGHNIENRTEKHEGLTHSWFRLLSEGDSQGQNNDVQPNKHA